MGNIALTQPSQQRLTKVLIAILIALSLFAVFLPRLAPLASPNESGSIFAIPGSPQLTNPDGYYYLRLADEIAEGSYSEHDLKRIYPEGIRRKKIPPLLSTIIAGVHSFTNLNLAQIGTAIPPIFAFITAIPIFLISRRLTSTPLAILAVFLALSAPSFLSRTSLGHLDTDALNLYFPLMISYSCYCATRSSRAQALWLINACIHGILFYLWWAMAPEVVAIFFLWPLLLTGGTFFVKATAKIKYLSLFFLFSLLVFLFFFFPGETKALYKGLLGKIHYIFQSSGQDSLYPQTGLSNLEQQNATLDDLSTSSVLFAPLFYFGLLGLFVLLVREPYFFVFFLPLLGVAALSFLATRFLIFLIPGIALGIVYLLFQIPLFRRSSWSCTLAFSIVAVGGFFLLQTPRIASPVFSPATVSGMKEVEALTEKDAIIYSWWDIGHPMIYYGKRAVLADGAYHGAKRTMYLAKAFIEDDPGFTANYIQFYTTHGLPGFSKLYRILGLDEKKGRVLLHKLLALGPQKARNVLYDLNEDGRNDMAVNKLVSFLFPADSPPAYFFLEKRHLNAHMQRSIYWYGSWDIEKGKGEKSLPTMILSGLPMDSMARILAPNIELDYEEGTFTFSEIFNAALPLSEIRRHTRSASVDHMLYGENDKGHLLTISDYTRSGTYQSRTPHIDAAKGLVAAEAMPHNATLLLQDIKIAEMFSQRLFYRSNVASLPHFTLISEIPGAYQLWRIEGDSFAAEN